MAEDLAAFGAPRELVEAWRDREPEAYEVMTGNWPAVELFLACSTQWRVAGMAGVPIGLDYVACGEVLRAEGRDWTPGLLADLKLIEVGAVKAIAERRPR